MIKKELLLGDEALALGAMAEARSSDLAVAQDVRAFSAAAVMSVSYTHLDVYKRQDLDRQDIDLFLRLYESMLPSKGRVKVLLQTYFCLLYTSPSAWRTTWWSGTATR